MMALQHMKHQRWLVYLFLLDSHFYEVLQKHFQMFAVEYLRSFMSHRFVR